MQKKLNEGQLLDDNGYVVEAGYSTSLVKTYDRAKIKANKYRIKEWDYYLVYNDNYGVAFTIDDNSYMGLNSFSFLDFRNKKEITKSFMSFMTKGKTGLPASSKIGDVSVNNKKYKLEFLNDGEKRVLTCHIDKFAGKESMDCQIVLTQEPKDSMVIVTPFKEKKTHFYYNQKIVGFVASGYIKIGDKRIDFEPDKTRGILDWGRGVWTYKNTWYWGAGAGVVDGKEIAFNVGYGFGDTSKASENMVFVDGKAHKLDKVMFNIPRDRKGKDDYLSPWTFSSNDSRFEMNFTPLLNRHSNTDVGIIGSNQNQVFGFFNGKILLDDGNILELKNFLAFAEKVINKW